MLKKYLAASLTVFTLLHPSVASARQWVLIGNNPTISVDIDSIKREGILEPFGAKLFAIKKVNPILMLALTERNTKM